MDDNKEPKELETEKEMAQVLNEMQNAKLALEKSVHKSHFWAAILGLMLFALIGTIVIIQVDDARTSKAEYKEFCKVLKTIPGYADSTKDELKRAYEKWKTKEGFYEIQRRKDASKSLFVHIDIDDDLCIDAGIYSLIPETKQVVILQSDKYYVSFVDVVKGTATKPIELIDFDEDPDDYYGVYKELTYNTVIRIDEYEHNLWIEKTDMKGWKDPGKFYYHSIVGDK